jgi:hypothetical protein
LFKSEFFKIRRHGSQTLGQAQMHPPKLWRLISPPPQAWGHAVPPETMDMIARRVQSNIRELEGSLNRIVAFADLSGMSMTMPLAKPAASRMTAGWIYSPAKVAYQVTEHSPIKKTFTSNSTFC